MSAEVHWTTRSVLSGHTQGISCFDVLSNGTVATGSFDKTVRLHPHGIFDAAVEPPVATAIAAHAQAIVWLSSATDGTRFYTASFDKSLRVWDAQTAACVGVLQAHEADIVCACVWRRGTAIDAATGIISTSSDIIFSGDRSGVLYAWDVRELRNLGSLRGSSVAITCMAITSTEDAVRAGATRLYVGNRDGRILVYDAATRAHLAIYNEHQDQVRCLAVQGDYLFSGASSLDTLVRVWRADPLHASTADRIESPAEGPCVRSCLTTGEGHTNTVLALLPQPTDSADAGGATAAGAPRVVRVATVSRDASVRVWELTAECIETLRVGATPPEGAGAAAATGAAPVEAAGTETPPPQQKKGFFSKLSFKKKDKDAAAAPPAAAAPEKDPRLQSGCYPRGLRAVAILASHSRTTTCLAASHSFLFSGSEDGKVCVWRRQETGTWGLVTILVGHSDIVERLLVVPGSNRVLSAACDGTVRVWDTEARPAPAATEAVPTAATQEATVVSPVGSIAPDAPLDTSEDGVKRWTKAQVAAYLAAHGLDAPACTAVSAQDVDGASLLTLSEDEIKELGLTLGQRKKFVSIVAELKRGFTPAPLGGTEAAPLRSSTDAPAAWEIVWSELTDLKEIGHGAYGIVCSGSWRGAKVAVKQLPPNNFTTEAQINDFRSEAKLMLRLHPHPNVVQVLGMCSVLPNIAVVTEFCAGGSLESFLHTEAGAKINYVGLLGLASTACAGLLHLSAEGVIHRDVAARNFLVVLIGGRYACKVTDFGMARLLTPGVSASATTETFVGPVKWMAPEALGSRAYSMKSDVWSFGVTLWEMWARQEPYPGMTVMAAGVGILRDGLRLTPPAGCPQTIQDLIAKCQATQPDARPSFSEILEILQFEDKAYSSASVYQPFIGLSEAALDPRSGPGLVIHYEKSDVILRREERAATDAENQYDQVPL